jgi:hypothetical protein
LILFVKIKVKRSQPAAAPTGWVELRLIAQPLQTITWRISHERRPATPDLSTWQRLFDDQTYWQQSPDAHYFDLQRIADDLLGQGAIDLEQWQILRAKADDLHKNSPAANVANELDDPDA